MTLIEIKTKKYGCHFRFSIWFLVTSQSNEKNILVFWSIVVDFPSMYISSRLTFSNSLLKIFTIFKAKYCEDLPFDCLTKADYVFLDADHNGVLTWSEWKTLHG